MSSGIYQITQIETGRCYIGSAVNINCRWSGHKYDLLNNKHHSRYLQRAWNKYGAEAFEFKILEECSKEQLIEREQWYLDKYNPAFNTCKIAGNTLGVRPTEEQRQKLIQSHLGQKQSKESIEKRAIKLRGQKRSPEVCKRLSDLNKGKVLSEEHKMKLSLAKLGKKRGPHSEDHKQKIAQALLGRQHTEERKLKNSLGQLGKTQSLETRVKMSNSHKKIWVETKEKRAGKNHWNFGRAASSETKEKIRLAIKLDWQRRKQFKNGSISTISSTG